MVELKVDEDGEEFYERTVVVREEIIVERIKRVDVNTVVEEVKMVPRKVEIEKLVEVPEIVCKEIPNYKEVEVPEIVEQVVYREVPVPQYVEVEVPEVVEKTIEVDLPWKKPIGREQIHNVQIRVPRLDIEIEEVKVPLYVPVFIEVPVPVEQLNSITHQELLALRREIELAVEKPPRLAEYERLGLKTGLMKPDLVTDPTLLKEHWINMCRDGCTKTRPMDEPPAGGSIES